MTVYADILFIVNFYVDALLLAAVRRFLRLSLRKGRFLLSAVLGGAFGLCALLPDIRGFPLLLLGAMEALALAAAAFAPKPFITLLKAAFLLLLFGAALSGLLLLAQAVLPLRGVLLSNGAVYFDISAPALVLLTCAAYGVLYLFDRLFRKREPEVFFSALTVTLGGKSAALPSKLDTGLTLREPFSGLPVIVAERRALLDILPVDFGKPETAPAPGLRLVPFTSLGADGLLPAFRPDAASLSGTPADCWIAVSDRPLSAGAFSALVPASLLPEKGSIFHDDRAHSEMPSVVCPPAAVAEPRRMPLHKRTRNAAPAVDTRGGAEGAAGHPRGQAGRARPADHAQPAARRLHRKKV